MKERYRTVAEGSSARELRGWEKGFAAQSKAADRVRARENRREDVNSRSEGWCRPG